MSCLCYKWFNGGCLTNTSWYTNKIIGVKLTSITRCEYEYSFQALLLSPEGKSVCLNAILFHHEYFLHNRTVYKQTLCHIELTAAPTLYMQELLQWRHNWRDGISNHHPHHCLLKRLFRRRPKKTSKLRVTGLCVGNSPVTGEFPAQMASNAENVSILWRHHGVWST